MCGVIRLWYVMGRNKIKDGVINCESVMSSSWHFFFWPFHFSLIVLSMWIELIRDCRTVWSFHSQGFPVLKNSSVTCFFSFCVFLARIGKMKRRKPEEGGQVCPLCSAPLAGSEEEMSRHVEQCLIQVVPSGPPKKNPRLPPVGHPVNSSFPCRCWPVTCSVSVRWSHSSVVTENLSSGGSTAHLSSCSSCGGEEFTLCLQ